MSLKDQIFADMKSAMRDKDASRLESIRLFRAAIQRREVDERIELSDEDVLMVLQKQIKQSQDAVKQFIDGDRKDLADKEQIHIDNLKAYLPAQLDEAEVSKIITDAITEVGAKEMRDMGKVMAIIKPKLQGKADMGKVSGLIKTQLQG